MGGRWTRKVALLSCVSLCFVFFFAFALLLETGSWKACLDIGSTTMKSFVQGSRRAREASVAEAGRRNLMGRGSHPPRCTSKCGNCTPCQPVQVAVPPGTPATFEYYPVAWRCKCGARLFLP
ncbi:epidermal patterning factor-like protein [Musa troglodytarum]|uniref:Epidermal patterning factor-like protein n=1 Tax=Musa troglodytarum TaxID=320322 RepID=A0A9E7GEX9_9LILI|nr:epidermal patterning factor-like protein [Musa troglodytarum]